MLNLIYVAGKLFPSVIMIYKETNDQANDLECKASGEISRKRIYHKIY